MGTGGGREIGSSDVCSCGSGEVYTLGETLGSEYGAEEGSSGEMSIEELKASAMGESLGSEYGTEVGYIGDISGGEVGYYLGIPIKYGYGKHEGYPLGDSLVT